MGNKAFPTELGGLQPNGEPTGSEKASNEDYKLVLISVRQLNLSRPSMCHLVDQLLCSLRGTPLETFKTSNRYWYNIYFPLHVYINGAKMSTCTLPRTSSCRSLIACSVLNIHWIAGRWSEARSKRLSLVKCAWEFFAATAIRVIASLIPVDICPLIRSASRI